MSFNKIAILDKDGTLVRPKSGAEFVQNPEDQELLPGVAEAVARLVAEGWDLAIATNQGGVAAGYKTLEDAIEEVKFCMNLLPQCTTAYFCPDFEGEVCWLVWTRLEGDDEEVCQRDSIKLIYSKSRKGNYYRKPNPGMIDEILDCYEDCGQPFEAVLIGDMESDREAAEAAGIRFVDAAEWRAGRVQI